MHTFDITIYPESPPNANMDPDKSLLFTSHTGEVMEVNHKDVTQLSIRPVSHTPDYPTTPVREISTFALALRNMDGSTECEIPPANHSLSTPVRPSRCGSASSLIEIVTPEELVAKTSATPEQTPKSTTRRDTSKTRLGIKVSMAYNEYGELVREDSINQHPTTSDLTVTELLRVIRKGYHHRLRDEFSKVILPRTDGSRPTSINDQVTRHQLSSWNLDAPRSPEAAPKNSHEGQSVPVYQGPPRALEVGCSSGEWCFTLKGERPDWLVEGIDDTDHWSCVRQEVVSRDDFVAPIESGNPKDYFGSVRSTQEAPEFSIRNINCLQAQPNPIPHNLFDFIRAREIFDRVESYKTFLDDIRLILRPDGIVEFLEIDPRPRALPVTVKAIDPKEHKSGPKTDWTDRISDRFEAACDEDFPSCIPGWTGRVAERLKSGLRSRDGVAAANLKSWLEGVGFWDVKQVIVPMIVGGDTESGKRLKEFILFQIQLEEEVPKLKAQLPKVEMEALESGACYLNLHIVTARKPHSPRPGDLLIDGQRQGMTASIYDAMARLQAMKTSQWKRFDLEGQLKAIVLNLPSLSGAPETPTKTRGTMQSILPLISRPSTGAETTESPFNSPPFVTLQQLEDHKNDNRGVDGTSSG